MQKRPLVATILAAEARQKNPAMRMAEVMAFAEGKDLSAWLQEASGDVSAEYGEFLIEIETGLPLQEAIEAGASGSAPGPVYTEDRSSCEVALMHPLANVDGSEPDAALTLRRITRYDIITEMGAQTWTEPSTTKSLRILAIATGIEEERLKVLDFGDYLRLQGALADFS